MANLYLIPLFMGFSILVLGSLRISGVVNVDSIYVFCISLSGLSFSIGSFIEECLGFKELEGEKGTKGKGFASFIVMWFLGLGIFSIIALPLILNSTDLRRNLAPYSDGLTLISLGLVISSIGIREATKYGKKMLQNTKMMEALRIGMDGILDGINQIKKNDSKSQDKTND